MRIQHWIGFGAFLAVLSPVSPAASLLPNGDFSTAAQLNQWSQILATGTVSWNSDDAGASPNSGSIELDAPMGQGTSAQSACFNALGVVSYTYGGQSKVINTGPTTISFSCTTYSNAACTVVNTPALPSPAMSTGASWTTATFVSGVLPTGTLAVRCVVSTQPSPATATSVRFDNLTFGPTIVPVRLQDFYVQ